MDEKQCRERSARIRERAVYDAAKRPGENEVCEASGFQGSG